MRLFDKYLKNNRGATSVLIMIMMIVLMVFGLAALTTSAASKKLSQKNTMWLTEYYKLQGNAESMYAHLDETLDLKNKHGEIQEIDHALLNFLKVHSNCSYESTGNEDRPFLIEVRVQDKSNKSPQQIYMKFAVEKDSQGYQLKTQKWLLYQEDIFDPNDEIQFSDIKIDDSDMKINK